jgi:hypothetical protein
LYRPHGDLGTITKFLKQAVGLDAAGTLYGIAYRSPVSRGHSRVPTTRFCGLEHVRVRQNQHLQFGNNRGCAEDAVTMATVATPARRFGRPRL